MLPLTGCTTPGPGLVSSSAPASDPIDAAWIARNGPSPVPREGWEQTTSGWYRNAEACLRFQEKAAAGTGAVPGEGCLEPGI